MDLNWTRFQPGLAARGRDQDYLITWDSRSAVLTRWRRDIMSPGQATAEAALNAISVPAAAADGSSRMAAIAGFRETAQMYEAGIDIDGQPAWIH